jgi:uncharacterized membrane protein HdeD (DUF308 family)
MKRKITFGNLEKSLVQNKNFVYTITSLVGVIVVFLNLNSLESPLIGSIASVVYFGINAVFLGNALFGEEKTFFRLAFGILLLVMLLGFFGWLVLIIYNLDASMVTLVLLIVAVLSSLLNWRMKHKVVSQ